MSRVKGQCTLPPHRVSALKCLHQRFPNFLGCGTLLLLNIFRGPHGGLADTKGIYNVQLK